MLDIWQILFFVLLFYLVKIQIIDKLSPKYGSSSETFIRSQPTIVYKGKDIPPGGLKFVKTDFHLNRNPQAFSRTSPRLNPYTIPVTRQEEVLPDMPGLKKVHSFDSSNLPVRHRATSQDTHQRKINMIGEPATTNLIAKEKPSPTITSTFNTPGMVQRNSPLIFNRSPTMPSYMDSNVNSRLGSPGRGEIFRARDPSPVFSQGRSRGSSSTNHERLKSFSEMVKEESNTEPAVVSPKPRMKMFGFDYDYHHYLQILVKEESDNFEFNREDRELSPNLMSFYIKWIEQQANLSNSYKIYAFATDFLHNLAGQELMQALNTSAYYFREQKKNHGIVYERFYYFLVTKELRTVLFEFDTDQQHLIIYYPYENQLDPTTNLVKSRLVQLFNIYYRDNKDYHVSILSNVPTARDVQTSQLFALEYFKNRAFDKDPRMMTLRSVEATKETILKILKKRFKPSATRDERQNFRY